MPPKKDGRPKGAMTSYAAFVQVCRDEHRKKHPEDSIVFAEFSRKCSERWKGMNPREKKRFEDIANKDKARYQREMASYVPADGVVDSKKRKQKKDPNAPKRALSAFFFFCGEYRGSVKEENPSFTIGEIAKELGKRWEVLKDKEKYNVMAADDKIRYANAMAEYNGTGGDAPAAKKSKGSPKKVSKKSAQKPVESEEEESEEEEEDSDE